MRSKLRCRIINDIRSPQNSETHQSQAGAYKQVVYNSCSSRCELHIDASKLKLQIEKVLDSQIGLKLINLASYKLDFIGLKSFIELFDLDI